ncbi:S-layer homology domain-containing protein [Demequina rhizosphaerae]|uniref:S-layer homology domain-containing protein n=1 Tax=Demequina rhizosphaerae TaxID=1638985 RepID=UPI0009E332A7|nr:S-layer homology domain-containing protein [Demequina rhizosphaerae]
MTRASRHTAVLAVVLSAVAIAIGAPAAAAEDAPATDTAVEVAVDAPSGGIALSGAASITGAADLIIGVVEDGRADLYTWSGEYVASTAVEDGAYRFDGVPVGEYRVRVTGIPGLAGSWVTDGGVVAVPARLVVGVDDDEVTAPTSTTRPFTVLRVDVALPALRPVPGVAEIVCVAAYPWAGFEGATESVPAAVDCASPGTTLVFDELETDESYLLRAAREELVTGEDWTAYEGEDCWYGGAAAPTGAHARAVSVAGLRNDHPDEWIPFTCFTDVRGASKGFHAINWAGGAGIVSGFDDGTFEPRGTVTRRNLAKLLYRHAGRPEVDLPEESPFTDIEPGDGGYRAMVWLHQTGIASGYDDGSFKPNRTVTRRMVAKLLYRYAGRPAVLTVPGPLPDGGCPAYSFTDVECGDGSSRAIAWLGQLDIVSGFSDGTFRPNEPTLRRQLATVLYRYEHWVGGFVVRTPW